MSIPATMNRSALAGGLVGLTGRLQVNRFTWSDGEAREDFSGWWRVLHRPVWVGLTRARTERDAPSCNPGRF